MLMCIFMIYLQNFMCLVPKFQSLLASKWKPNTTAVFLFYIFHKKEIIIPKSDIFFQDATRQNSSILH
jgi:hypothetical protein